MKKHWLSAGLGVCLAGFTMGAVAQTVSHGPATPVTGWFNNTPAGTSAADCWLDALTSPWVCGTTTAFDPALLSAASARVTGAGLTPDAWAVSVSATTFRAQVPAATIDLTAAKSAGAYADFPFTMAANAQLMQFGYRTKVHPITVDNEPPADAFTFAVELIDGGSATLLKSVTAYDGSLPAHNNLLNFDHQPELTAGKSYSLRVYFLADPAVSARPTLIEWDDMPLVMRPTTVIPAVPVNSPWMLGMLLAGLSGLGAWRVRRRG